MLNVSEKLVDKYFFCRINSITNSEDAVANEVVYHDVCWVKAKQGAKRKPIKVENFVETLSDIKLVNYFELEFLLQEDYIMTMNDVDKIYKKELLDNGVNENELLSSYKKRLKKLLQENLPILVVVKSTQRNRPEQFMTRETQQEAVATFNSAAINENDMKSLWKLSKQIRKEILSKNWEFAGTFEKYKQSKILCMFLKWMLIGPHNSDRDRTTHVETVVEVAAQIVS